MRFGNDLLVLYIAENSLSHPRLGVSVGKSCGAAVIRNRLKRLLREVFRQSQDKIPTGFDYVLMFSQKAAKKIKSGNKMPDFEQVKTAFGDLVADAGSKITK